MKFNNVSIYYETPFHGITQRASPRRDKSVGRWLTRYRPRLFSHLETGQPAQPVGIDTETIRRAADEDLNAEEKPSVSEPISCFERKRCTVACWRLLEASAIVTCLFAHLFLLSSIFRTQANVF